MQKPPSMTAQQWVTRVRELDGYLPLFPNPSDTREAESLPEDKLLDALECLSPPRWQRKMMEHGFDPLDGTIAEFINFCENCIEPLEALEDNQATGKGKRGASNNKGESPNKKHRKGKYFCDDCGENPTHNTAQCWYKKKNGNGSNNQQSNGRYCRGNNKNHNKNSLAAHYFCLYVRKIEEAGMDDSDLAFETYLFLAKFFKEEEKYELAEDYAKEALKGESTKEEAKHILKSIEESGHRIEQEVS